MEFAKSNIQKLPVAAKIATVIIALYYVLLVTDIVSITLGAHNPVARWASIFTPTGTVYVLRLANEEISDSWLKAAERFHSGNGAVFKELAAYYMRYKNPGKARLLAAALLVLDPKSIETYGLYTRATKAQTGQHTGLVKETLLLSAGYLDSAEYQAVMDGMAKHTPSPSFGENTSIDYEKYISAQAHELLARIYYEFGHSLLTTDPQGSYYWWNMARRTDPGVSYYAVEQAALASVVYSKGEAKRILMICEENIYSRTHCADTRRAIDSGDIPIPGDLKQTIEDRLYLVTD